MPTEPVNASNRSENARLMQQPLAMGILLASFSGSMVSGAAAATFVYKYAPVSAAIAAAVLLTGMYMASRHLVTTASLTRIGFITCLAGFLAMYGLVLTVHAYPFPFEVGPIAFAARLIGFFLACGGAVLLPFATVLVAIRRSVVAGARRASIPQTSPAVLVRLACSVLTLLVSCVVLIGPALSVNGNMVRLVVILVSVAIVPLVTALFWGACYRAMLRLWRAEATPGILLSALERLKAEAAFEFDGIICVKSGYGRACEVVHGIKTRATLVISADIIEMLGPSQLLAVLAHEAAHVRRRHFLRTLRIWTIVALLSFAVVVGGTLAISPLFPRYLRFVPAMIVVLFYGHARALYETAVTRRHEAEADGFAVSVAGGDALMEALHRLMGDGDAGVVVHDRWTTHGTWETRSARIRALAAHSNPSC